MKRHMVAALAATLLSAFGATAASADVGQARTAGAGANQKYDRNASVVKDGAATYAFFARSEQQPCNRLQGCDADNSDYDLYYKKSLDGGQNFGPAQLAAVNVDGAGPFRGRTIAATATADGVHVFWASGGNQNAVYHLFKPTGSDTFTPPAPVAELGSDVFNVEAVSTGQTVWVYTENEGSGPPANPSGPGIYATQFTAAGAVLTQQNQAQVPGSSDKNIPKGIVDNQTAGTKLTMVQGSTGSVFTAASPDGVHFSSPVLVVPAGNGITNWDPQLTQKPNGEYYLYYAPDQGNGSQRIGLTTSRDFVNWTSPRDLTPAEQGGVRYWDYWPEGFVRGNQIVLFYTSERGFQGQDGAYAPGTGHIWTDPGFGGFDHNGPAA